MPLEDLVKRMDKASKDSAVKAVVIVLDQAAIGSAQVEELRQAIARLEAAGKEVIAHADTIGGLGQYALISAASRLSVVPTADLWITGLFGESPYIKRLLDKLDVKPDFMTCGDYKSAAEIFMREGPSKEAEAMQNWLLDSLYDTQVNRIAASRKVSPELVRAWIDSGPHSAEKAKELGMVDTVEHRQDLEASLKHKYGSDVVFDRKYGKKAEPKLDASSPFGLFKFWGELLGMSRQAESKKPAVGIVYVEGPIVIGGQAASLFQDVGRVEHVDSPGPRHGGRRRRDQGRGPAGRFTGRLGPGQRDHPRRHPPREGQEAVRRLDGQRGRQRRLLRRLRGEHDLRRRSDHHRLDRRRQRQARHQRPVRQARSHLQVVSPRSELGHARLGRPLHAQRTAQDAVLHGRDLRRLQGPRHGDSRQPAQEADRRPGRRPRLHRQAGPRARPGRPAGHAPATPSSSLPPRPS